jgi:hypothetical protein
MCTVVPALKRVTKMFQFTRVLISFLLDLLKINWEWYNTSNIQQTTNIVIFQKKLFKIQSTVWNCILFIDKQMALRKTINISEYS